MQIMGPTGQQIQNSNTAMRMAAKGLEEVFLAEMLKTSGIGKQPEAFGGGIGEDQFSSFLVENQAKSFSVGGGVGLAEHIFQAMKRAQNE